VFINSRTNTLGNLDIRVVWSIALISEDGLTKEQMHRLLTDNAQVKYGSWQIVVVPGREMAVFSAQIAADTDSESLHNAIRAVSMIADEMEKEFVGTDDR
jgi:hypothetical protein